MGWSYPKIPLQTASINPELTLTPEHKETIPNFISLLFKEAQG